MTYKKGERVVHPMKSEWGIGEVISDGSSTEVTVFFERAGEKTIALSYVKLVKVFGREASSVILDRLEFSTNSEASKGAVCSNCGAPTHFGQTATLDRLKLRWCEPCYRHSQRTFEDRDTGEKRFIDELRTIDGIKTRYSPK